MTQSNKTAIEHLLFRLLLMFLVRPLRQQAYENLRRAGRLHIILLNFLISLKFSTKRQTH